MRALCYIVRLFLVLALLAVVLLGCAYAWLRSDAGMDFLAREIEKQASDGDMHLTLSGLRGDALGDVTLASLQLSDREGVWLELHGLRAVWSPVALLRGQAPLALLEAGRASMLRMPLPSQEASGQDGEAPSLRRFALYLPRVLDIRAIHVAEPVTGIEQHMSLKGSGDEKRYELKLSTLQGVPLALDALVQPQQENFAAKVAFHESEGGVVAALLQLPNNIALSLDADISADSKGDIAIRTAALRAGSLSAEASGNYAVSSGAIDLSLVAHAPDMVVAQALAKVAMSGSASLKLSARGTLDKLTVVLEAESPHLVVQEKRFDNAALTAKGILNPGAWGSDAFTADGTLKANGRYRDSPFALDLAGTATHERVAFSPVAFSYAGVKAAGKLEAEGTPEQFGLTGDMDIATPDGASQLAFSGEVDSQTLRYTGDVKAVLNHRKHRFDLAAALTADEKQADISRFSLKGSGVEVEGKGIVALQEVLADAALTVRASDLAPLGQLLGEAFSGSLHGDITLNHSGGRQSADMQFKAQKLALPGLRVASMEVAAKASDAWKLEGIDASISASGMDAEAISLATLNAVAKGGMEAGLAISAQGRGTVQDKPMQLAFTGTAQRAEPQHYRLDIATLEGSYDGAPLRMVRSSSLDYGPASASLSPLMLELAGGSVSAEGKLKNDSVTGRVKAASIALQKLRGLQLPAMVVDATFDLSGTAQAPTVTWSGHGKGDIEGMEVAAEAKGSWKAGTLESALSLQSGEAASHIQLALPARLSLQPFATDLRNDTPLKGTVKTSLPLAMFNARIRADGHRLGGMLSGEAALAGTLGAPYFDGAFTLANGRYDHHPSGVCLRDVTARISGNKQAVRLETFSATDIEKRHFTATASLALTGTPTLSGEAKLDHFKLFCGGMMNGSIHGGLAASGTIEAMTIAGELELESLNIQIPGARAASEIPQVQAQWVRPGVSKPREEAKPGVVALDIRVSAPRQLFVRGRGLDAEFEGALAVTGTVTTPKLDGQFSKRHGTFILLDRVMELNTATIRFEGPMPPSPFLSVEAVTKVQSHTITASLSGNAAKPALALSSSPALPKDEVLALLLFGRQLESISPFEALQLAQATRTLAGHESASSGVIGGIRDKLGLDRLQVGADEDSNVNVSTGKYVTDDVYVGVVQGAKVEDRKVVTEITLTPSISGKTTVDGAGNQSVGMEWKKDY